MQSNLKLLNIIYMKLLVPSAAIGIIFAICRKVFKQ